MELESLDQPKQVVSWILVTPEAFDWCRHLFQSLHTTNPFLGLIPTISPHPMFLWWPVLSKHTCLRGVQKAKFEIKVSIGNLGEYMQHWSKPFLIEDTYYLIYFLKNWIYNISVPYKSIYLVDKHNCPRGNTLDTSF